MDRVFKQNSESGRARRVAQGKLAVGSQQGEMATRVNASPLMTAQRHSLQGLFGPIAQRQGAEEEALQGRFNSIQRVEEEEPLQGKFDSVQRVEEEEPLQGKFEGVQRVEEEEPLQGRFDAVQRVEEEPLQGKFDTAQPVEDEPLIQGKFDATGPTQRQDASAAAPNQTGLPDNLKSGIETLSGVSLDGVKVHYNSSKPAQLNALAYAQGTDIHVAPGQEKHLPHEAWHVVQQAQGRGQVTRQMKEGVPVNDDQGLEAEADAMGAKAMQMRSAGEVAAASPSSAAVQREEGEEPDWDAIPTRGRSNAVIEAPGSQEALPSDGQGTANLGSAVPEPEGQASLPLDQASTAHLGSEDPSMSTVAKHLSHQENREKLASVVEQTSAAKEVGSQTSELAENVGKLENAPKMEAKSDTILDKVKGAWESFKESTVGKAISLVGPVVAAVKAFLGMKEKWHIWTVFENTATVTGSNGKKVAKPDAPPEAKYGLTKAPSGFARQVKEFFMSIFELTTKILAFVPGAQMVAAGMKVFSSIAGICERIYAAGKGFYQYLFGEKKVTNSTSLMDKALGGDTASLEVILNLKLPSIEGSSFAAVNWVKEKLHGVSLENIGAGDTKSERMIDQRNESNERIGPPKTKEELFRRLTQICKNPSSKELIRKEIQEAMTGYGK
jgi:hypothetical protein